MEQTECLQLEEDFEDVTLDDDIEMTDAELMGGESDFPHLEPGMPADNATGECGGGHLRSISVVGNVEVRHVAKPGKKRNRRKKNRRKKGSSSSSITDINRFVIDTCRLLKEKKSYLIWNAVGCLGVSAVSDLVKEVGAIQQCGGQKTADGKRFRTGGGVLWNILKTREPKAFKEIMAKGKEFEKQFRQPQIKYGSNKNDAISQPQNVTVDAAEKRPSNSSESIECSRQMREPSVSLKEHSSARDRIRVPVAYDDLFEEGEIHEF